MEKAKGKITLSGNVFRDGIRTREAEHLMIRLNRIKTRSC
jgi:hypothetical protein